MPCTGSWDQATLPLVPSATRPRPVMSIVVSDLSVLVWKRSPAPPIPMPCSVVSIFTWTVLCAFHAASPPVALTVSARISSGFLGFGAAAAGAGLAGFAVAGALVVGGAAGAGAGAAAAEAQPRVANRIQDVAGARRMPEC